MEALDASAAFCFLTDNIQYLVNELSTFGVVTLGALIACANLPKIKIVWSEGLAKGASPLAVHRSWLKVHQNDTRDVAAACGFLVTHI